MQVGAFIIPIEIYKVALQILPWAQSHSPPMKPMAIYPNQQFILEVTVPYSHPIVNGPGDLIGIMPIIKMFSRASGQTLYSTVLIIIT